MIKIKQLIRTCLSFLFMSHFNYKELRIHVYKIARKEEIYESRRKNLINRKR
jgi:hypothetical protein